MNAKTQKPNPRSEKSQSASFLIWFISGLYLLGMVWFLLSTVGGYSAQDTPPWLVSAVVACTVSYGILMVLFWPFEDVSPPRPERLVR
jgi:apolipoprotein N-acyltransferase